MVDLAKTRPAIFILRKVSMVLNAEAADVRGATADIRNRIKVEIIHNIARVIIDLHRRMRHFLDNLGARFSSACFAPVLFDHEHHAVVLRDRSPFLESFHPQFAMPALCMAKREDLRDSSSGGLKDARAEYLRRLLM